MLTPTDDRVTIKGHSSNARGVLTVLELENTPMHGPASHVHHREDEIWYVLEGEFRFMVGDEHYRLSKGGMAFGPRDTPHCFQNIGGGPGRLLIICTPAGVERFFQEFAAKKSSSPVPTDPGFLAEIGHGYGVDFVGPPLAVSHPL
jgi:mannose-6-phosphate isomerase-like protein (cupin superfamily)